MKDAYINIVAGFLTLFAAIIGVFAALINVGILKPELTFNTNWIYIASFFIFVLAIYLFRKRKATGSGFYPIAMAGPIEKYYFKEMPLEKGVYWNAYTEDYPVEKKFKNKLRVNIDGNPHCPECKTEFNVSKGLFGYTWKCPMCGKKMRFRENLWDEKESVKRIIKSTIFRYFENS
jgi:ribosomal protein L37AE/L43A